MNFKMFDFFVIPVVLMITFAAFVLMFLVFAVCVVLKVLGCETTERQEESQDNIDEVKKSEVVRVKKLGRDPLSGEEVWVYSSGNSCFVIAASYLILDITSFEWRDIRFREESPIFRKRFCFDREEMAGRIFKRYLSNFQTSNWRKEGF